jgi:signal transduction histidine kinase
MRNSLIGSKFSSIRSKQVQRYLVAAVVSLATVSSLVVALNLQLRNTEQNAEFTESTGELRLLAHAVLIDAEHTADLQTGDSAETHGGDGSESRPQWEAAHRQVIDTQLSDPTSTDKKTIGLLELQRLFIEINRYVDPILEHPDDTTLDQITHLRNIVDQYMDQATQINERRSEDSSRSFTIIAALSWAAVITVFLVRFVGLRYIVIPGARTSEENEVKAEIGRLITSATSESLDGAWEDISTQIRRLLPWDRFVIGSMNPRANTVRRIYVSGDADAESNSNSFQTFTDSLVSLYPDEPTTGLLFDGEELNNLAKTHPEARARWDQGLRSLVTGPFIWQGEVIGAVSLWSREPNTYDSGDRDLMLQIANQIVGAVVSSRDKEIESTLAEMGRVLSSGNHTETVFNQFFDLLSRIITYDRAVVTDIDVEAITATDRFIRDPAGRGSKIGQVHHNNQLAISIVSAFTNTKSRGVLIPTSGLEKYVGADHAEAQRWDQGFRSLIAVPLVWHDQVIGGISLRSVQPNGFAQRDVELLERVADQIAGASSALLAIDREQKSRLETQRLEEESKARSDFLSMVTHELKTPLTASVAFADILARNSKDLIPQREYEQILVIQRNSRYLEQMINDLLELSRLERGRLNLLTTEFPVQAIIDDCLTNVQSLLNGKGQTLTHTDSAGNTMLIGDQLRLLQVMQNLLVNAIKYSENGTEIECQTAVRDGMFCVEIHDRGIGINLDEIETLFEPFKRGDEARDNITPGIGAGLYLAKQIVAAHNGTIGLKPRKGGGTTAHFEIPLAGPTE